MASRPANRTKRFMRKLLSVGRIHPAGSGEERKALVAAIRGFRGGGPPFKSVVAIGCADKIFVATNNLFFWREAVEKIKHFRKRCRPKTDARCLFPQKRHLARLKSLRAFRKCSKEALSKQEF